MRSFLVLVLVGSLGFLAGCGSGSGGSTPVGVPVTLGLTPASAFANAGKSVSIVLSTDSSGKGVTWSVSPSSGAGTLSSQTTTSVTFTAPSNVATNSLATVIATSIASTTTTASLRIPLLPAGTASDVQPISVNGGPLAPASIYPNGAFTSVIICVPNTSSCQTINNILVDTGSFGLRILASEITISLQPLADTSGNTLNNCVNFLDGSYLWGFVEPADVVLGGEVATITSIQAVADPQPPLTVPSNCSTGGTGTNEDTQATLGANGILGVGPEPFDCGTACDPLAGGSPPEPAYYLCSSSSCSPTFVSCGALCGDSTPNSQMTNPVFNFAADNNGVILELPSVPDVAPTVSGNMIFGIGTQSNNGLGSATIFAMDSFDNFTTTFNNQVLPGSFIDSGSNGLFFPAGSPTNLTACSSNPSWYCSAAGTQNLTATNGSNNSPVNFSVDDFDTVTQNHPTDAAFSNLAGPNAGGFDWGLPFFYGRAVYTAIDGTTTPYGDGPFWAY